MTSILEKYIREFARGSSFDESDAEPVLDALIESTDETLLAAIFAAWHKKAIEEREIYSFAKIMRGRCKKVNSYHEKVVDIVGTGGSKVKTFNVSTAAAFVVAGAGIAVAKHGNKAATSSTGSADVLNELGIDLAEAELAEKCLNEIGICFMFAPNHHRLSPTLAKVRRGLGFPTIFNCVGPLCNPADVPFQLIGVWDRTLVPNMANALAKLGTKKSWIVHGENGLDEIAVNGVTHVAEVADGRVREFTIEPKRFGIQNETNGIPKVNSSQASAELIRKVLSPSGPNGVARTLVLVNATAAIYLSGCSDDLRGAFEVANSSIASGGALNKLESFVNFQRK